MRVFEHAIVIMCVACSICWAAYSRIEEAKKEQERRNAVPIEKFIELWRAIPDSSENAKGELLSSIAFHRDATAPLMASLLEFTSSPLIRVRILQRMDCAPGNSADIYMSVFRKYPDEETQKEAAARLVRFKDFSYREALDLSRETPHEGVKLVLFAQP